MSVDNKIKAVMDVMTERELHGIIHNSLARFFIVESEVKSDCRTGRIDIIMTHKSDIAMRYPIGIEIKKFDKKTGADVGKWLHQAQRYTEMTWGKYGRIVAIVAPQISGYVFDEAQLTDQNHKKDGRPTPHHNVSTFLGQFGVGELQTYFWHDYSIGKDYKRMRIVYKGWAIWDQAYDELRADHYDRICRR